MHNISRRAARECALKTLYGFEFSREADPADFFELSCSEFETASDEFSKKLLLFHGFRVYIYISERFFRKPNHIKTSKSIFFAFIKSDKHRVKTERM